MHILQAETADVPELYRLQLIAFESEAEMIGSRLVPALLETKEENENDFANWTVLKMTNDKNEIVGAVRFRKKGEVIEVGRLMTHPKYRRQGLAKQLLAKVDAMCPNETKELYTCTKSVANIRLYEKMGYKKAEEFTEATGLTFVYMRKK